MRFLFLFSVTLFLLTSCGGQPVIADLPKAKKGEPCNSPEACADHLYCIANLCSDGSDSL